MPKFRSSGGSGAIFPMPEVFSYDFFVGHLSSFRPIPYFAKKYVYTKKNLARGLPVSDFLGVGRPWIPLIRAGQAVAGVDQAAVGLKQ